MEYPVTHGISIHNTLLGCGNPSSIWVYLVPDVSPTAQTWRMPRSPPLYIHRALSAPCGYGCSLPLGLDKTNSPLRNVGCYQRHHTYWRGLWFDTTTVLLRVGENLHPFSDQPVLRRTRSVRILRGRNREFNYGEENKYFHHHQTILVWTTRGFKHAQDDTPMKSESLRHLPTEFSKRADELTSQPRNQFNKHERP